MNVGSLRQEAYKDNREKKTQEYAEAMKKFLDEEDKILDFEIKLGQILFGMSKTIYNMVNQTSDVYGLGVSIYRKENILQGQLKKLFSNDIRLTNFNPNLERILLVLAHTNEVLKVLVRDQKNTEVKKREIRDKEIWLRNQTPQSFSNESMPREGEITFSLKDNSGYDRLMRTMKNYTEISGGMTIEDKYYKPFVEEIIKYIETDGTSVEKRDLILRKISEAFEEIMKIYEEMHKQDNKILEEHKQLLKNKKILSMEDKKAQKELIELIQSSMEELIPHNDAMFRHFGMIGSELKKIAAVIDLDKNIKVRLKVYRKEIEKYEDNVKKGTYDLAPTSDEKESD